MKKINKPKNLVQSWVKLETTVLGNTLAQALRELNEALGTIYTHSRIGEFSDNRNGRGTRLPPEIRSYMLKKVLAHVLAENSIDVSGLSKSKINKIVIQFL